jgi:hypothetical protein
LGRYRKATEVAVGERREERGGRGEKNLGVILIAKEAGLQRESKRGFVKTYNRRSSTGINEVIC